MKIITPGNTHDGWKARAECKKCGCVMMVEEADIRWHYKTHRGAHPLHDTTISEIQVDCATCMQTVVVCQLNTLPIPVQDRLRARRG